MGYLEQIENIKAEQANSVKSKEDLKSFIKTNNSTKKPKRINFSYKELLEKNPTERLYCDRFSKKDKQNLRSLPKITWKEGQKRIYKYEEETGVKISHIISKEMKEKRFKEDYFKARHNKT